MPILRPRTPAIQVPNPPLEGPRILREHTFRHTLNSFFNVVQQSHLYFSKYLVQVIMIGVWTPKQIQSSQFRVAVLAYIILFRWSVRYSCSTLWCITSNHRNWKGIQITFHLDHPNNTQKIIVFWQPLGPRPKVKLWVGYMWNPTKLKEAKGIRRSPKMCHDLVSDSAKKV